MEQHITRPYVSAVIRLTHHDGSSLDEAECEHFTHTLVVALLNTIESIEKKFGDPTSEDP